MSQIPLIPKPLGDGEWVISHEQAEGKPVTRRVKLNAAEQVLLTRLMAGDKLPELYWRVYGELRHMGHDAEVSACGAWYVLGPERRPTGVMTQAQFAQVLGVHRLTVLRHIQKMKPLLLGYRLNWWAERLVHLDEATFRAAISDRGTAGDRKLAYQVAAGAGVDVRIEPTGEAVGNDYADLLAAIAAQEK